MSLAGRRSRSVLARLACTVLTCALVLANPERSIADVYSGRAAIMADESVISIRYGVKGLVFDTTCSSCKSQYPEWMFLGNTKVDSIISFTDTHALTESSDMEGISVNSEELLAVLAANNVYRLMKSFPRRIPSDSLYWNEKRAEWKVLPDLTKHYYIEFDTTVGVQGVVDQLSAVSDLLLAEPYPKPRSEFGDGCDHGVTEWIPDDIPNQEPASGWHIRGVDDRGGFFWRGMNAECAWGLLNDGERGNVRIAVVEVSPVYAENPDLNAVNIGASWSTGLSDHATWDAGCAAAKGNNLQETGIATIGIAPDAEIYGFSQDGIISDIVTAADPSGYNCDIVLLPYSVNTPSTELLHACETVSGYEKPLVVTVGNIPDYGTPEVTYPASWDDELIISVGASNRQGELYSRSNYTPPGETRMVDFIAPGEMIYCTTTPNTQTGYYSHYGTCPAAALTAGLIALIRGVNPSLAPYEIETCLESSASTEGLVYDVNKHGAGRIDAFEALYGVMGITSCCQGKVGDVNNSGGDDPTIGDVSFLIDHLFITGIAIDCIAEADVNQSGGTFPTEEDLSIADVSVLIDALFISFGPTNDCL